MSDIKINIELDAGELTEQIKNVENSVKGLKYNTDQLDMGVQFLEASKAIEQLNNKLEENLTAIQEVEAGSEAYNALAEQIEEANKQIEEQKQKLEEAADTVAAYQAQFDNATQEVQKLNEQLKNVKIGSDKFKDLQKQIKEATKEQTKFKKQLEAANNSVKQSPSFFSKMKPAIKSVGLAIKSAFNIIGLAAQMLIYIIELFKKLINNVKPLKILMEKIEVIVDSISSVLFNMLGNILMPIFEAIGKFFQGDFSGAWDSIKQAGSAIGDVFSGKLIDNIQNATEAALAFKEASDKCARIMGTTTNEAEHLKNALDKEIASYNDATKSVKEHKESLEKAKKTYEQLIAVYNRQKGAISDLVAATLNKNAADNALKTLSKEQTDLFMKEYLATGSLEKAFGKLGDAGASIYDSMGNDSLEEFQDLLKQIEEIDAKAVSAQNSLQGIINANANSNKKVQVEMVVEYSQADLDKKKREIQNKMNTVVKFSAEWQNLNEELKKLNKISEYGVEPIKMQVQLGISDDELSRFRDFLKNTLNSDITTLDPTELQTYYEDYLAYLEQEKEDKLQLNEIAAATLEAQNNIKATNEAQAKAKQQEQEAQQNIVSAYNDTASAIGEVTGETEAAAKAQQAMNLALQIQAMAQAIATASKGDPYTVALRIAAASAAVVASMAKFTKFATGGIVEGQYQTGDMNLVAVNGGEMILNKNQQGNLFRLIQNGSIGGQGGDVQFRISGKDLVGTLNNYNKYNSLTK